MSLLSKTHLDIYREFNAGHFTVQKTNRVFSAMPTDQAHEQNNACVKSDGGAVDFTDNPSALRRWMIAGPEIAKVISEFETQKIVKWTHITMIKHLVCRHLLQEMFAL